MLKKIFFIFVLLVSNSFAEMYDEKSGITIKRTIDGDTLEISAPFLPPPLKPSISLRIIGLDTPEKTFRAHCPLEASKAESASEFTKKLIDNAREKIVVIEKEDKYFRLLGDVILDGKSLRDSLLENGFAKPYYGEKKPNWCDL